VRHVQRLIHTFPARTAQRTVEREPRDSPDPRRAAPSPRPATPLRSSRTSGGISRGGGCATWSIGGYSTEGGRQGAATARTGIPRAGQKLRRLPSRTDVPGIQRQERCGPPGRGHELHLEAVRSVDFHDGAKISLAQPVVRSRSRTMVSRARYVISRPPALAVHLGEAND